MLFPHLPGGWSQEWDPSWQATRLVAALPKVEAPNVFGDDSGNVRWPQPPQPPQPPGLGGFAGWRFHATQGEGFQEFSTLMQGQQGPQNGAIGTGAWNA